MMKRKTTELGEWAFGLHGEVYLSNSLRSDRVLGMGEEAQSCGFNFFDLKG